MAGKTNDRAKHRMKAILITISIRRNFQCTCITFDSHIFIYTCISPTHDQPNKNKEKRFVRLFFAKMEVYPGSMLTLFLFVPTAVDVRDEGIQQRQTKTEKKKERWKKIDLAYICFEILTGRCVFCCSTQSTDRVKVYQIAVLSATSSSSISTPCTTRPRRLIAISRRPRSWISLEVALIFELYFLYFFYFFIREESNKARVFKKIKKQKLLFSSPLPQRGKL